MVLFKLFVNKFRMMRMKAWMKELASEYEGKEITNSETGDVTRFICDTATGDDYEPYTWKHHILTVNGKPVFEINSGYYSEYGVSGVKRFNYGSWYHDVHEFYKAHMKLKKQEKKRKRDALFSPLDE